MTGLPTVLESTGLWTSESEVGEALGTGHNHIAGEEPRITYVHFHGQGAGLELAVRLDRVLALTGAPRPVAAAPPQPLTIDTALVFGTLGLAGRAQGAVAQVSTVLVPGPVRAVADLDHRVVVDKPKRDPHGQCRQ